MATEALRSRGLRVERRDLAPQNLQRRAGGRAIQAGLMAGSEYPNRFSASIRCSRIRSSRPYRRAPPSVRCDGDSKPIAS